MARVIDGVLMYIRRGIDMVTELGMLERVGVLVLVVVLEGESHEVTRGPPGINRAPNLKTASISG